MFDSFFFELIDSFCFGRVNKSNKNERIRSLSMPRKVFCSLQMLLREGPIIPRVDYIVQYDSPDDPRDYIHRVGCTARARKVGKSLLFLMESELGFLRYLKEAKVPLDEFVFPKDRIENVQTQVSFLCGTF